jgi:drug/metabolite transporter (DMT)-like permease
MFSKLRGSRWLVAWAALVVVYFMWGSTFTAIQVAVRGVPPFLMAGSRFLVAGVILYLVAGRTAPGHHRPSLREVRSAAVVGALLLLGANGLVSWAELRVPSGMAALMIATVPLWMAILAVVLNRAAGPGLLGWAGVAVGLAGVAVLAGPGSGGRLQPVFAAALLLSSLLWAAGSLYSRTAPLPRSLLQASALEMLAGGVGLVALGAATGELHQFHIQQVGPATVLAFGWLVVGGSLLGYSCYVFALASLPTTTVATYAYVNPLVAIVLGWVVLGQGLTLGTVAAAAMITVGVVLMVSGPALARRRRPAQALAEGA